MEVEAKRHRPKSEDELQFMALCRAFDEAIQKTEGAIALLESAHIGLWTLADPERQVFERLEALESLRAYLLRERQRTCTSTGSFS